MKAIVAGALPLEVGAAEIRIRSERRLGEMLAQQKAGGGLSAGSRGQLSGKDASGLAVVTDDRQKSSAPKLSDAGISKDLSARAQKLAAVPQEQFEAEVGQWRERVNARLEKARFEGQQFRKPYGYLRPDRHARYRAAATVDLLAVEAP